MSSVPRAVVRHTKLGRKSVAAGLEIALRLYETTLATMEWSAPVLVTAC